MRVILGQRKNRKYLFKIGLILGLAYTVAGFANQRILISNKKKQIDEMKEKIGVQESQIKQIKSELDDLHSQDADCLERVAHQSKFYKYGERVFVNAKGN